jgi:hypothetical protein
MIMDIKVKALFLIISVTVIYFIFDDFKDQKENKYIGSEKVLSTTLAAGDHKITDSRISNKVIEDISRNSSSKDGAVMGTKSALDNYFLSDDNHFKNKMVDLIGSIKSDKNLSTVYNNMDYSDVRLFSTFVSMASAINTYKSTELLLLAINNTREEDVEEYMSGIKILYSNAIVQDTLIHIDNFIEVNSYYPNKNQTELILYITNKVSSKQGVKFLEKNLHSFNDKGRVNNMIKTLKDSDSRTFK